MIKLFTTMLLLLLATAAAEKPATPNRLGPGDVLSIRSPHSVEFGGRNLKIDESGAIYLAMIGRVQATGKTPGELAIEIENRLEQDFLLSPQISVQAGELASQPAPGPGAATHHGN
jgi:polysaccharide biosynthesis/export protein